MGVRASRRPQVPATPEGVPRRKACHAGRSMRLEGYDCSDWFQFTICDSCDALMQRILAIHFPFWPVEQSVRSLQRHLSVSSPAGVRAGPSSRVGPDVALAAANHLPDAVSDPAAARSPGMSNAGRGWRHPRTMAAVWADARVHAQPESARVSPRLPAKSGALADGGSPGDTIGTPLLVVAAARGVRTVVAACPCAMGHGVRIGMTLAQAKALCPSSSGSASSSEADGESCVVLDHDPHRDAAALRGLAARLLLYVPSVALATTAGDAGHGGASQAADASLWGDLSGCERLIVQRYGDERGFLAFLHGRLARRGLTARLAVGSTAGVAWACARYGPSAISVVPGGDEVLALGPLPIESLRLAPADAAALREVQVERVGQLLALDREELGERLGHSAVGGSSLWRGRKSGRPRGGAARRDDSGAANLRAGMHVEGHVEGRTEGHAGVHAHVPDPLQRLDQALGRLPEPLLPVRLTPPCRVLRTFDGPVMDPEVIELASADLVDSLCRLVRRHERGIRRLRWRAERANATPLTIEFDLGAPTRRRAHLWALLQPHLERLDGGSCHRGRHVVGDSAMGYGIESITLTALRTTPVAHQQRSHAAWTLSRTPSGSERTTEKTMVPIPRLSPRGMVAWAPHVSECLDMLIARFGPDAVRRAIPVESHEPERAFEVVPLGDARCRMIDDRWAEAWGRRRPLAHRPSWLLPMPEAIVMEASGHGASTMARFLWRDRWRRVLVMDGWECIDESWWGEVPRSSGGSSARRPVGDRVGDPHAHPRVDATRLAERGGERRPPQAATPIPSPIVAAMHAADRAAERIAAPLSAELLARRRWYCRVLCDEGLWLWLFRLSDGALTFRDVERAGHDSASWFVHGGWC